MTEFRSPTNYPKSLYITIKGTLLSTFRLYQKLSKISLFVFSISLLIGKRVTNWMARHEELPIPILSDLEPVYGSGSQLEEAQLRFKNLKAKFIDLFAQSPHVYARSPGQFSTFFFVGLIQNLCFLCRLCSSKFEL